MTLKTKLLTGLFVSCLIDTLIPLPLTGLILVYIVLQRPPWFADLYHQIYTPE